MNAIGRFILNQTSTGDEPISDAPDPTDASPFPGSSPLFLDSRITGEPVMSCRELKNTPIVRKLAIIQRIDGKPADPERFDPS